METSLFFQALFIVTTLFCSLVAGFLFAFAVVVMPGIKKLGDKEFIKTFQSIDRIIQDNQPAFMLIWAGSVLLLLVSTVLGFGQLDQTGRWLLLFTTALYLLGVQLPTGAVNVPLNNQLQTLDVEAMDEAAHRSARETFESRWNSWNVFRTIISTLVSVLLIFLIFRL